VKLLFILVLAVIVAILLSCNRQRYQVDIVLPPGFQGVVELRLDPVRGIKLQAVKGSVVINIPQSGIVYLNDLELFHRGVHDRVITADGTELDLISLWEDSLPGVVRAYALGWSGSTGLPVGAPEGAGLPPRIGYFIGTPEDWKLVDHTKIGF